MAKTLVYQLYPISWEGGLKAMTEHLEIINDLGADYVWLSPLYPSPRNNQGYDVADFEAIDSRFGNFADFDNFIAKAHSYGIGVLMDLILNHTATEHQWFRDHPEYYCWTELNYLHRWTNLLDGSKNTWVYDEDQKEYYLHLFHETEADLNWFPWRNHINKNLVYEYRQIVKFWTVKHHVDGFRLSATQAINKDLKWPDLELSSILFGGRAEEVIRAVFYDASDLFLMMDCHDPTYGGLTDVYTENTQIDFITNAMLKDATAEGDEEFMKIIEAACSNPRFMLDLEAHNSIRFPARIGDAEKAICTMFTSRAEGICLYQGEELGLTSPTTKPLELMNYDLQMNNSESNYNRTKKWIDYWRMH